MTNSIRIGIGGWNFAPWRGSFYPEGLPQKSELEYASRQLTTIEINSTFYRGQTPSVYAKWREATPPDFLFPLKGPRIATHRARLAEAGEAVTRFVQGGIAEFQHKLGPIVWQLPPTHRYDADDLARFFELLPRQLDGQPLRHVLDARHDSYCNAACVRLARQHGVGLVVTDSEDYPMIADRSADFVYLRLMRAQSDQASGYAPPALRTWAGRITDWGKGKLPTDLAYLAETPAQSGPCPVFAFVINGAKERAPAAAMALMAELGLAPG